MKNTISNGNKFSATSLSPAGICISVIFQPCRTSTHAFTLMYKKQFRSHCCVSVAVKKNHIAVFSKTIW